MMSNCYKLSCNLDIRQFSIDLSKMYFRVPSGRLDTWCAHVGSVVVLRQPKLGPNKSFSKGIVLLTTAKPFVEVINCPFFAHLVFLPQYAPHGVW